MRRPGTTCAAEILWYCLLLATLTGCAPSSNENAFEDYLNTLSTDLALAIPVVSPHPVQPGYPADNVQLAFPADPLDHIDFLNLSDCALQATVIRHNSRLGQAAKPSQRLLLELEYLQLAPTCIQALRANNNKALANVLDDMWHEKREQLPARIYNATLGSDEHRAFWLPTALPGHYPRVTFEVTTSALATFNRLVSRWLSGDYRAENRKVELLLGEIAGGGGGALLARLFHQRDSVSRGNLMLDTYLTQGIDCQHDRHQSSLADFHTKAYVFYNTEIQPRTDYLQHKFHEINSRVAALEQELFHVLPHNYHRFMVARNALKEAAVETQRQHLALLKQVLWRKCPRR